MGASSDIPPRSLRGRFLDLFLLSRRGRYAALEGIRGYMLLLVVFAHAVATLLESRGVAVVWFGFVPVWSQEVRASTSERVLVFLGNLHYVVDVFFVLSAFLMTRIVMKQEASFSYGRYLRQRALRIYPPVFVALGLAIAVECFWLHRLPFNWKDVPKNLLFLQAFPDNLLRTTAYNFPTWSLFYECSFYLVFPLVYFGVRRYANGSLMAGAGVMALLLLTHCWMPRACAFAFGVLLGLQDDGSLGRLARKVSTWAVIGVYLAFALVHGVGIAEWSWFTPLFGIGATLLILKAGFDEGPLNRFFSHPVLRWFGNVSFSLYLCHNCLISASKRLLQPGEWTVNVFVGAGLFFAVTLAVSSIVGVVLFAAVESWHYRKPRVEKAPEQRPPLKIAA